MPSQTPTDSRLPSTRKDAPPMADLPTKRRRKEKFRRGKPRRDNRKSRFAADYIAEDERHNVALEAYYRAQKIVPENEYDELFATLAIPLPSSFRVLTDTPYRGDIQEKLRGEMQELFKSVVITKKSGDVKKEPENVTLGIPKESIKPPSQLPWYPDGLAWTVSAPRQMLRRENELSKFHKFLVRMNELGAINRQEAVSMVPPLMLDVEPGQSVLDMCAAPGSKTAQILEKISPRNRPLSGPGVVIANDADVKRCWMLAHQLKRFGSPELVVTQHEAQYFPQFMSFDRILCDVPCTGDGTLRKAPDIWRRWTPEMGIGIHRLQRQILNRGINLLKPGGRLVYSTCSMNPLENEAVVADALRSFGDEIELIDVSDMLPELKRRPGLSKWMVKDMSEKRRRREGDGTQKAEVQSSEKGVEKVEGALIEKGMDGTKEAVTESIEGPSDVAVDANAKQTDTSTGPEGDRPDGWFTDFEQVPLRRRKKIVRSAFAPSQEELDSGKFPLERCLRLVPHDQDTGAFFVAVLMKRIDARLSRRQTRQLKKEQELSSKQDCDEGDGLSNGTEQQGSSNASRDEAKGENEKGDDEKRERRASRLITDDPLVDVSSVNAKEVRDLCSFFGLNHDLISNFLMTRCSDGKSFRRVLAVSRTARTVIRHAIGTKDEQVTPDQRVLRLVNAGVRVVERTDRRNTPCPFRIVQDGVHIMRQVMKQRVYEMERETVRELFEKERVMVHGDWKKVVEQGPGSAIVWWGENEEVAVWVGKNVVFTVVPKEVSEAFKQRVVGV